jgi:putative glutamine amidotransferase
MRRPDRAIVKVMSKQPCPIVAIPACIAVVDGRTSHRVGQKYIESVIEYAGGLPLLVPAMGEVGCFQEMVARFDGVFLTGAASNVEPHHYNGTPSRAGTLHDPGRDATALPLIRAAVEAGVPLFAICRGIQELNVALGGSLHQNVHELPGKGEHRMNRALPSEMRVQVRHPIAIQPGGMLERLCGRTGEVMVNSLHAQGIDRLAEGLFVEAVSDDGIVEAVSLPRAKGFVLGVQWHPEHQVPMQLPLSKAMFDAFGDACRKHLAARQGHASSSSIRAA